MAEDIYIATHSFTTYYEGRRVMIRRGRTRVRLGHPLIEMHPEYFKPIDVHYDVEMATAGPGERRGDSVPPEPPRPDGIRHLGGGWYETPDGERHQGREAAVAHMDQEG